MKITSLVLVFVFKVLHCSASDDSSFQLINKATSFCLVRKGSLCSDIRWTTAGRLLVEEENRCLGVQGKSVGSEVSLYDCDETSELQKWECKNETVLALQDQELYIELIADGAAALSNTTGPNNHLTISGTSSGACAKTYREIYTIGGNAAGRLCMFPFFYNNQWYSSCTEADSENLPWCAVETKYEHETWGYCSTNSKENWIRHSTNGAAYQLNTQSALTWWQAESSCKQQSSSLLSITDPHEQAFITAQLDSAGSNQGYKLWTGLTLNTELGWKWSNGDPFRYLKWDSGYPMSDPGHNCGIIDGAVRYSWQSSKCDKKLGYICYSKGVLAAPTEGLETGFCSAPWIPYNGHCFHLQRTEKTWPDAQLACRKEGGDLVSIRNTEDQSFVISQLGYASTDELWIGLNDRKSEGLFDWSDHSTVSFTSWEFGKPAITPGPEDCALLRGESGNWADRDCKEKHGFICMKTSASVPSGDEVEQNPGCKTGWKRHGSYCYFIGTETKTFDEAKGDCTRSDSYLADVSTRVDNAFLVSLAGLRPEKHFWLGLSNQADKDVFKWTNSDSVSYTHWNAEMPGNHQGCVAMATGNLAGLWDVLPCTNREKYICKHQAAGAVLTPAPTTAPSTTCANEWNKVASRNVCYKIYTEPSNHMTWNEARDYCKLIGGDLLSIHSADELQLKPWSYGRVWIGLSAPNPGAGFVWSDGSPVNFQHWKSGEPNNKDNLESCAEFYTHLWDETGSWNDAQCEDFKSFVCQIPAGLSQMPPPSPPPPDFNTTSDGWLEWRGNQYFITTNTKAMEDALRVCKEMHSDLVTINSEDEWVFLRKRVYKTYGTFWIGMSVDFDKSFRWMDNSPVMLQKWDEGQPSFNHFDENCVVMKSETGRWHDYNCGYEFQSICKRSSSPPVNATVAPTLAPKGGCKDTWKKFNSKCYKTVNNQNLTWMGARQECLNMGGNLASIPSRHVQVFLMSQMADAPTTDLWIGLHSSFRDGFYWTDGRPKSYMNLGLPPRIRSPLYLDDRPWYGPYVAYEDMYGSYGGDDDSMRENEYMHQGKCVAITTNSSPGIGKWRPTSCDDTNGYICQQNLDPSLPDSSEPTSSSNYIKILNDSVKLVPQQMSWHAARENCEAEEGASLVSLRTEWMQTYIELLALNLKRPVWIGLNKVKINSYFQFSDGWPIKFTHWDANEPRRMRNCVYMDVDGKWKTSDCNQSISSVCMMSTDVPPTTESKLYPGVCPEAPDEIVSWHKYSWRPFRGYCYIFISENKDWSDAASNCLAHDATLVSIEDPFEQKFIEDTIKSFQDSYSSYWIGLYKTFKGEWLWLDKAVLGYTNWGKGEPSYHKFGMIGASSGMWTTGSEQYSRPFICKTPKVQVPKSTLSPDDGLSLDGRSHVTLVVVIVASGLAAAAAVIALFLFRRSGRHLPIPKLSTFENPLFSNNQPKSGLVKSKKTVENADDGPVIIL